MCLSLSGIRSSLCLMLYALIHRKDSQRAGWVEGAHVAHPVPSNWCLRGGRWQSPGGVWRGATEGCTAGGALPTAEVNVAARGWRASLEESRDEQCLLVLLGHEANIPVMNWEITEWGEVMKMRTSSLCLLRRKEELMAERCQGNEVLRLEDQIVITGIFWMYMRGTRWDLSKPEKTIVCLFCPLSQAGIPPKIWNTSLGVFFLRKQNLLHWSGFLGASVYTETLWRGTYRTRVNGQL